MISGDYDPLRIGTPGYAEQLARSCGVALRMTVLNASLWVVAPIVRWRAPRQRRCGRRKVCPGSKASSSLISDEIGSLDARTLAAVRRRLSASQPGWKFQTRPGIYGSSSEYVGGIGAEVPLVAMANPIPGKRFHSANFAKFWRSILSTQSPSSLSIHRFRPNPLLR